MDIVLHLTEAPYRTPLAGNIDPANDSVFMSQAMNKVIKQLAGNFADDHRTAELARIAGLMPWAFSRSFQKHTGLTPVKYLTRLRIDHACSLLLADPGRPVIDIAFEVGFNNLSNFNRHFLALKGMAPSRYRHLHIEGRSALVEPTSRPLGQPSGVPNAATSQGRRPRMRQA